MTSAGPDGEAPDSGPLPTMGTQVGDFTLLDVLGTGGAGVVYRALQRHPVRTVALKLLREGLAGSAVRKRFEVEAEILARTPEGAGRASRFLEVLRDNTRDLRYAEVMNALSIEQVERTVRVRWKVPAQVVLALLSSTESG